MCNRSGFDSTKTSSQVITRSRAGTAATRQLSSYICADGHVSTPSVWPATVVVPMAKAPARTCPAPSAGSPRRTEPDNSLLQRLHERKAQRADGERRSGGEGGGTGGDSERGAPPGQRDLTVRCRHAGDRSAVAAVVVAGGHRRDPHARPGAGRGGGTPR